MPVDAARYKQSQGSHAYAAGVAYWEHDYLNGATNSDNLVRRKDSTFTNILLPAAKAVGRKIAALPPVNGCVPGQISVRQSVMVFLEPCRCLLHDKHLDVSQVPQPTAACLCIYPLKHLISSGMLS